MTFAPRSLGDLGSYWTKHGGVFLGVVGNQRHCGGYHLGKDRIMSSCACKPDGTCEPGKRWADYSVQHARDKAGLTNAAAAIDLGRLNGKLSGLYAFSRWLVAECQANQPGSEDVREAIYSPDGKRVQRYSGIDGEIHTGPGNGDLSHLTHTHISYFRDSEDEDKRPLFSGFFDLPDTDEDEVPGLKVTNVKPLSGTITVKTGQPYAAVQVADLEQIVIAGLSKAVIGEGTVEPPLPGGSGDRASVYLVGDELAVVLKQDVASANLVPIGDRKQKVVLRINENVVYEASV